MLVLEKYYQQQFEDSIRHLILRWVLIFWSAILIVNLTVLAVIYFSLAKGWLRWGNSETLFADWPTPAQVVNQAVVEEQ